MKIAILSDLHLGYSRFEEDAYTQAEMALLDASGKSDLILCAGDIFDVKIPKLETLKRAIDIFKKASVPILAIHGNHERRSKGLVNPVQLLSASTGIRLLHGESTVFEKDTEKLQVFGFGSVPEEYAEDILKKVLADRYSPDEGAFRILLLHQSVKDVVAGGDEELSLEYLETLPFDLIIDGHIHKTTSKLGGRFLIPGSTVITQLKKDETDPKGYFLYDTSLKKAEFIPISSRRFFYEELVFTGASESDVRTQVKETVGKIKKDCPTAIIALKLCGTLKPGISGADVGVEDYTSVFIENRLDAGSLGARLEKIRSMREQTLSARDLAIRELSEKTSGKITLFDCHELFEKLVTGVDETLVYLAEKHSKPPG